MAILGKQRRSREIGANNPERAYDAYLDANVPEVMLTPSEAASMNRDTPNNAFMQKVGDEFYYPEELMPSVVVAGLSEPEYRRSQNIAEGNAAASDLSQRQNYVGSRYIAPAFGATLLAPWAVGGVASALGNAGAVGQAAMRGLRYLQPSTYLEGTAGTGLGSVSLYPTGATTLRGAAADALMDSYFAVEGARNLGRSGSAPGEILNAMNFLPLVAPAANAASRSYNGLMGARAARRAGMAADAAARERGMTRMIHNVSGETVYLTPDGTPMQYINGEFVPFNENSEWTPNSLRDYIAEQVEATRARMNGREELPSPPPEVNNPVVSEVNTAELPFYTANDDLSGVSESQLQRMASGWRDDPELAHAATDELFRRGAFANMAYEQQAADNIVNNEAVQDLMSDLDLVEAGEQLASPESALSGVGNVRPLGNIITDPGGLLSRPIDNLNMSELELIVGSPHATDAHRQRLGAMRNRQVNNMLDSYAIEEWPEEDAERLLGYLDDPNINYGLAEDSDNYLDVDSVRHLIEGELNSRGSVRGATQSNSASSAATANPPAPQTTPVRHGVDTSGSQPVINLMSGRAVSENTDFSQLDSVELGDLYAVLSNDSTLPSDVRARMGRSFNYAKRTGRDLNSDIKDAFSGSDLDAYNKIREIARKGRWTLDYVFQGRDIGHENYEKIERGAFEFFNSIDERDLVDKYVSVLRQVAQTGISTLDPYYPAYMGQVDNNLGRVCRAEAEGVAKAMKSRFGRDVDFSDMDSVESVGKIQKFLREKNLVGFEEELPLDQAHLSYFADTPEEHLTAQRRGAQLFEQMPSGASLHETNTSTNSEPMKFVNAARYYGTDPGRVTIEYPRDPNGDYIYRRRNYYGNQNFVINRDGTIKFGDLREFKKYNPDFDESTFRFTPEEVRRLKSIQAAGRSAMSPEDAALVSKFEELVRRSDAAAMGTYDRVVGLYDRASGAINPRARAVPFDFFERGSEYFDPHIMRYTASYESPLAFPYMHKYGGPLLRQYPYVGQIPGVHRRDFGGFVQRLNKAYGGDKQKIMAAISRAKEGLRK